jgi:RND family efflux transporter MFP subunit
MTAARPPSPGRKMLSWPRSRIPYNRFVASHTSSFSRGRPDARAGVARHRAPAILPILALAWFAASGCRDSGASAARAVPPPTLVKLASVQSVPIEDASEYVASIQSLSSTALKPEVSNEITRVLVRSGDRVSAGQPLFVIDPRRQEATVTTQDAALAAQKSAATFAAQQLQRAKLLFAAGAISQQELEQAQASADAAQSQLSAQDARLQQERVTLQYYQVRAPSDGVVGDIPVRVGLHVSSDTVLTTVDRNQDLEVDVPVPLNRAPELRLGLPLEILDEQGGPIGRTSVFFISSRVDDQTQSVLVKGRAAATAHLRAQQFVRVRVVWRTSEGIAVPVLSVVRINGQPFVFVAQDRSGRLAAEQRLVRVGPLVGNDITIRSGLSAGERIVVSGVQKLANGAPIRAE